MSFTNDDRRDYLKFTELTRLRWKYIFDNKPEYDTFTFRSFLLNMWRFEKISLSKALSFLPEIRSVNTRREYIYALYDDGIIESEVYIGKNKEKRDKVADFGRGKASPMIHISPEARIKIDNYIDDVMGEMLKTVEKLKEDIGA